MSRAPPDIDGVPLLGNVHQVTSPLEFADDCRDISAPIARGRAGPQTLYVVLDPDLVQRVLTTNHDEYRKTEILRNGLDDDFDGFPDPSVPSSLRDAWQPHMSMDRVREYSERLGGVVEEFFDRWSDGDVRNVHRESRIFTFRLARELLLEGNGSLTGEQYISIVDGISQKYAPKKVIADQLLPDWVPTSTNRAYRDAYEQLDGFLEELLTECRPSEESLFSDLRRLERDPDSMLSRSVVRNELGVLLVGAIEPLAVALTCTFRCLAENPAVQERLQEETAEALGGGAVAVGDVRNLDYAEHVFREALRLYPPLYTIFRETRDETTLGGYELEGGAQVWLPQWAVHRDPQYFDRPETYDPSRWEGAADRPQFAYFPFGGGPRHCPSRRLSVVVAKVVLAAMAQRFEIRPQTDEELDFRPELALRPTAGLDLSVSGR